jgi:hypothetical protein
MKHYAIIGRIPFDDEDSCYTMEAESREEAVEIFEERIAKAAGYEDAEQCRKDTADGCIYINHVLVSESPIDGGESAAEFV